MYNLIQIQVKIQKQNGKIQVILLTSLHIQSHQLLLLMMIYLMMMIEHLLEIVIHSKVGFSVVMVQVLQYQILLISQQQVQLYQPILMHQLFCIQNGNQMIIAFQVLLLKINLVQRQQKFKLRMQIDQRLAQIKILYMQYTLNNQYIMNLIQVQ